ncbi:MAG: Asp-tRNA(Asn)/Glu-tRNA(Gln) amidotransferase subunit GatB [Akkermansiaceae bacterium]|nr:Asp-tRNA(Asn)/Glu-tRNA(Gln) amidotransferase subunit GatB [Akkermansiaceae bacterium]
MPVSDYLVTIGLEVHCQLKTRTKMFCACPTGFGFEPNTHVCPTCLGLPGALPVLNGYAIERTILAGLMLGCSIPPVSKWDRKNYFYADMPKNYQLSQLELPLCMRGEVPLYPWSYPQDVLGKGLPPFRTVKLDHIHLEEDVAKLTHFSGYSLIDFNRAGTPLMEIVSKPDLSSPEEAYAYLKSLQQILICGGISDADMEKGQMRCDVNVSLRPSGQRELGTKIEMKNINSLSAVRRALQYEIHRQADELDRGIPQVQSTRRWDDEMGESLVMRTKENAHDYRYHTCPDLVPVHTRDMVEKVRSGLPELPGDKHRRLIEEYGLAGNDADALVAELAQCRYFEEAARGSGFGKKIANWVINILPPVLGERGATWESLPLPPKALTDLVGIVEEGVVSNNQAREVLDVLWGNPVLDVARAMAKLGYRKADAGLLNTVVEQVIERNPKEVELVKGGNAKLINFLTGQVMKAANPKPNPKTVTELLRAKLGI